MRYTVCTECMFWRFLVRWVCSLPLADCRPGARSLRPPSLYSCVRALPLPDTRAHEPRDGDPVSVCVPSTCGRVYQVQHHLSARTRPAPPAGGGRPCAWRPRWPCAHCAGSPCRPRPPRTEPCRDRPLAKKGSVVAMGAGWGLRAPFGRICADHCPFLRPGLPAEPRPTVADLQRPPCGPGAAAGPGPGAGASPPGEP